MRSALRRQRHARRRSNDDELGPRIYTVNECVQPSPDEGVIQCADREQHLAAGLIGQAQLTQHHEQVVFGYSKLDVLALGMFLPPQSADDLLVGHWLLVVLCVPDADLVYPPSEIC